MTGKLKTTAFICYKRVTYMS